MSWFTKTVLAFVIVDASLILFLTFGAVFPKRIAVPEPGIAQAEDFYDFSAKASPVVRPRVVTARASFGEIAGGQ